MADGALDYALRLSNSGFLGPLGAAGGALASFTVRAAAVAAPIAAATAGAGALALALKGIRGAANLEQTQVAFRVLVGDVKRADAAIRGIKDLAASTPFEFPELADAGRKLVAFGQSAEAVPGTLRMIGDIAAGVQAPVGEIAELFGKAQVAGTLYAEDINQLVGRGIPVMKEFADQLGVGVDEVKKMASEGRLTFGMLERAFQNLTGEGGKFQGMMARMAETTKGRLSTLKDAVNEVLVAFGQPVNDAINPIITAATTHVEGLRAKIAALGETTATVISRGFAAIQTGTFGEWMAAELKLAGARFVNYLGQGMGRAVDGIAPLGGALADMMEGAGTVLKGALLDAATAFASIWAETLISPVAAAMDKLGMGGQAEALRSGARLLAQQGFGEKADAAKASGRGMIGSAFDALVRGASGGDIIDGDTMKGLEADVNEWRIVLDRQTRAGKAEADALAECEAAGKEHAGALKDATAQVQAAPPTPSPAPAAAPAGALAEALAGDFGGEGGDHEEGGRRRIRLYNAGDSLARRYARMSKADKEKFSGFSGLDASGALAEGAQLARGAGGTINPNATALGTSRAATKEKAEPRDLLSILRKIEENTAAFAEVAVA